MEEAQEARHPVSHPARLQILSKNTYVGEPSSWKLQPLPLHLELSFLKNIVLCLLGLGHIWDPSVFFTSHKEADQDAEKKHLPYVLVAVASPTFGIW